MFFRLSSLTGTVRKLGTSLSRSFIHMSRMLISTDSTGPLRFTHLPMNGPQPLQHVEPHGWLP